jgi:hypothetical protein
VKPGLSDHGRLNDGIIESMRIDLSDDELRLLIRAVEHYDACLLSQNRPGAAYADLLKSLKRLTK